VRRRIASGAVVALCGLTLAIPAPVSAAPPASVAGLASVDDEEAAGFARQRGIPLDEARRRLGWQATAPDLSEVVARDLGPRSGGVWVDVDDGDRVKVGVVGGADPETVDIVRRAADAVGLATDGYDLVGVRHPLAVIEADNDWLGTELGRVNEGASATLAAGLRPDLNAVELQTPREGTLTTAQQALVAEATKRLGDRLVVGSYGGRPEPRSCGLVYCDKPLRGGVPISVSGLGTCTAGFTAKSKVDDKRYLFTAGHCGEASGTTANWTTKTYGGSAINYIIGPVWHWEWNSGGDMGIIRINNVTWWNPKPWVFVTDGPDSNRDETYHISSDNLSVLGMRICTTGAKYGRTDCGFVTQIGVTVTYGGVTVKHLGRGSFCGVQGDSGSPMYALHVAYGLQVSGFSECDSLYQSIRIAEQKLNVNVLHGTS
jgi:hypothetical protein